MHILADSESTLRGTDIGQIQVIALITPYAINNAGWKFYLTFIVMIFLNMLFTFFFFPEVRFTRRSTSMANHVLITFSRPVVRLLKKSILYSINDHGITRLAQKLGGTIARPKLARRMRVAPNNTLRLS